MMNGPEGHSLEDFGAGDIPPHAMKFIQETVGEEMWGKDLAQHMDAMLDKDGKPWETIYGEPPESGN